MSSTIVGLELVDYDEAPQIERLMKDIGAIFKNSAATEQQILDASMNFLMHTCIKRGVKSKDWDYLMEGLKAVYREFLSMDDAAG